LRVNRQTPAAAALARRWQWREQVGRKRPRTLAAAVMSRRVTSDVGSSCQGTITRYADRSRGAGAAKLPGPCGDRVEQRGAAAGAPDIVEAILEGRPPASQEVGSLLYAPNAKARTGRAFSVRGGERGIRRRTAGRGLAAPAHRRTLRIPRASQAVGSLLCAKNAKARAGRAFSVRGGARSPLRTRLSSISQLTAIFAGNRPFPRVDRRAGGARNPVDA
jgi:hypothetical protein